MPTSTDNPSTLTEPASNEATPPCRERKAARARRLDRAKVLTLAKQGLSNSVIAKLQGCNPSTVWRYLQASGEETRALEAFKAGRGDAFATIQGKGLDVQHKLLDSLTDDVLDALSPHQKASLLVTLSTVVGVAYDKERLERGKSTQNIGLIARMMGESLNRVCTSTSAVPTEIPDEES